MPEVSIIILNYNTKNLLRKCLESLKKVSGEIEFETIVVDNASSDGSFEMLKKDFRWVKVIRNKENLGFAKGNNSARSFCRGKFILFLNSDTIVLKRTLYESVRFLKRNKNVGALTCKIVLPDGSLDKDARRSFITPWIGLTHIFLKLDRIFPKSRLFSRYWYGYIPANKTHEIDALQGAFLLSRKEVLDEVGWFDEDYFLDGEDIDICWKIKKAGFKIFYFPKVKIIHLKGASKGKIKKISTIPLSERIKYRIAGVDSMEIFYRKHLWDEYPKLLNYAVISGIKLLKAIRILTAFLTG